MAGDHTRGRDPACSCCAGDTAGVIAACDCPCHPAPAGRGGAVRTDQQIVDQTEELAALFMLEIYGRESVSGETLYRNETDPRSKHCWQLACKVQEMLTATDPENAASEVDDAPVQVAAPVADAEALDIELAELLADEIEPYATNGRQCVVDSESVPIIVAALRRLTGAPDHG